MRTVTVQMKRLLEVVPYEECEGNLEKALEHLDYPRECCTFLSTNVRTAEMLFEIKIPATHVNFSCAISGVGFETQKYFA